MEERAKIRTASCWRKNERHRMHLHRARRHRRIWRNGVCTSRVMPAAHRISTQSSRTQSCCTQPSSGPPPSHATAHAIATTPLSHIAVHACPRHIRICSSKQEVRLRYQRWLTIKMCNPHSKFTAFTENEEKQSTHCRRMAFVSSDPPNIDVQATSSTWENRTC